MLYFLNFTFYFHFLRFLLEPLYLRLQSVIPITITIRMNQERRTIRMNQERRTIRMNQERRTIRMNQERRTLAKKVQHYIDEFRNRSSMTLSKVDFLSFY